MAKQSRIDSLLFEIEDALDLDSFISYQQSWDYVRNLQNVKEKIDSLVSSGAAKQCVPLYEMFLSGCYEKADEIDDSGGNLGMFFEELFCSWVKARQKAGCATEETVHQIFKWMDNDEYGFCHEIEKNLIKVLNREGLSFFETRIQSRFNEAYPTAESENTKRIYDYPYAVRQNADILKVIYIAKEDTESYLSLCEKIGITPKDCENIAKILKENRQFRNALIWIDKGLELEKMGNWPNESSWGLPKLKRELLNELGRKKDAFDSAWSAFKERPSEYSYDEMMKYISKKDRKHWHKKAIEEAKNASQPAIIELCIKTKEWEILAESIKATKHEKIEDIGHYTTEKAAKELEKNYPLEAAKIYRALGMRIVKAKKSKYYGIALDHMLKAKKLYSENNCQEEWISLVKDVRRDHYRKYSFMGDFEKIVSGRYPEYLASFEERTRKIWKKQVSDTD